MLPRKKKEDNGIRFVITYDDGKGKCNQLYLKICRQIQIIW